MPFHDFDFSRIMVASRAFFDLSIDLIRGTVLGECYLPASIASKFQDMNMVLENIEAVANTDQGRPRFQ